MFPRIGLPLSLVAALACAGAPGKDGADTGSDPGVGDGCDADVTMTFEDGSEASFDCVELILDAGYEFDPDDAPEVRSLQLRLSGADSSGFDCYVDLAVEAVCGDGLFYELGGATSITAATFDCDGVSDAYEGSYSLSGGYVYLSEVSGGAESGDLTDVPVDTTVAGSFEASGDGIFVAGTFSVQDSVNGNDAEEVSCDGDEDPPTWLDLRGTAQDFYDVDNSDGNEDCSLEFDLVPTSSIPPRYCPGCTGVAEMEQTDAHDDCSWTDASWPESQEGDTISFGVDTVAGILYYHSGFSWKDMAEDGWVVTFSATSATAVLDWEASSGYPIESTRTISW